MRMDGRTSLSLILSAALALAAGCNSGTGVCPGDARSLAQYTITYTAVDGGDTCIVTRLPDGGAANSPLVSTPAANKVNLCASGEDGGALALFLGQTALTSTDQRSFTAAGSQGSVAGSACICPLDIGNNVSFTIVTQDGGPFAYDADAGFTPIETFSGSFNYAFAASPASGVGCYCNVPCGAHYAISGTH